MDAGHAFSAIAGELWGDKNTSRSKAWWTLGRVRETNHHLLWCHRSPNLRAFLIHRDSKIAKLTVFIGDRRFQIFATKPPNALSNQGFSQFEWIGAEMNENDLIDFRLRVMV